MAARQRLRSQPYRSPSALRSGHSGHSRLSRADGCDVQQPWMVAGAKRERCHRRAAGGAQQAAACYSSGGRAGEQPL